MHLGLLGYIVYLHKKYCVCPCARVLSCVCVCSYVVLTSVVHICTTITLHSFSICFIAYIAPIEVWQQHTKSTIQPSSPPVTATESTTIGNWVQRALELKETGVWPERKINLENGLTNCILLSLVVVAKNAGCCTSNRVEFIQKQNFNYPRSCVSAL